MSLKKTYTTGGVKQQIPWRTLFSNSQPPANKELKNVKINMLVLKIAKMFCIPFYTHYVISVLLSIHSNRGDTIF